MKTVGELTVGLLAVLVALVLIGYGIGIGYDTLTSSQGDDEPLIAAAICVVAGLGVFAWLADRHEF